MEYYVVDRNGRLEVDIVICMELKKMVLSEKK